MTEPGAGSDLANIKTNAQLSGDHYVVNGKKLFITNGIQADLIVVVCRTSLDADPAHRGISLLLVERGQQVFPGGRSLEK